MSLSVLTVSVNGAGSEVNWYFDREDQFNQALALVQKKIAAGAALEYGYQTDFMTDFSEFQNWLDEASQ